MTAKPPTTKTVVAPMTSQCRQLRRRPARPAPRKASVGTRVRAPPTSAPNWGAPSTTSAAPPSRPVRTRAVLRLRPRASHAPAMTTTSAPAASAKAVLETP